MAWNVMNARHIYINGPEEGILDNLELAEKATPPPSRPPAPPACIPTPDMGERPLLGSL